MLLCLLVLTSPGAGWAAEAPVSFRSFNEPDHYIRHRAFLGEIARILSETDRIDASFRLVPGLAGGKAISFESVQPSGHYLRHQGFRIKLHKPDGSDLFRQDASFWEVPGLADVTWSSFESVNYPGHYLRHRHGQLYIEKGEGERFRKDGTFQRTVQVRKPEAAAPALAAATSAPPDPETVALQSYNYRGHYVRHRAFLGELTPVTSAPDAADTAFRLVPGLAGGQTVSFESVNHPGHYLRHQGFRIKLHKPDGSDLFRQDASFRLVPGLADPAWRSFESVNYPGHHLRHRGFLLYIERGDGDLYRQDCTFRPVVR